MYSNQLMSKPYPPPRATEGAGRAAMRSALTAETAVAAYDPHYDAHPGNPKYGACILTEPQNTLVRESVSVSGRSMRADIVMTTPAEASAPLPSPRAVALADNVSGFLRAHIGNLVRVEFLLANATTDRVGVLSEVGSDYIVLKAPDGRYRLMCDLYSIKFVTVMERDGGADITDITVSQTVIAGRSSFGG